MKTNAGESDEEMSSNNRKQSQYDCDCPDIKYLTYATVISFSK
jgi:hypothetical protein